MTRTILRDLEILSLSAGSQNSHNWVGDLKVWEFGGAPDKTSTVATIPSILKTLLPNLGLVMATTTALPSTLSAPKDGSSTNKRQRPPTPEELVALYQSTKGLDEREASLKAIGDLQAALHRTVASSRAKDRSPPAAARKLDNLNAGLAIIQMKLDTKPGYLETFTIGVASGAALHGLGAVVGAVGNMWNSVRSASGTHPSS